MDSSLLPYRSPPPKAFSTAAAATATTPATTSSSSSSSSSNVVHKWGGRIAFCVVSVWLVTSLLLHATLSRLEEENGAYTYEAVVTRHPPDLFLRLYENKSHSAAAATEQQEGVVPSSSSSQNVQGKPPPIIKKNDFVVKKPPPPKVPTRRQRPQLPQQQHPAIKRKFEETHDPNDMERIRRAVENLRVPMPPSKLYANNKTNTSTSSSNVAVYYDIHNCPASGPPPDYPYSWPMRQILLDWNPDVTEIPSQSQMIHHSLCIFDWNDDYDTIVTYRKAEVPFIVQNHTDLMRTSERWMSGQPHLQATPSSSGGEGNGGGDGAGGTGSSSYLAQLLGTEPQRNEFSHSNHFMFWRLRRGQKQSAAYKDWQPPTENVKLNYLEWYQRAVALDQETSTSTLSNNTSSLAVVNDQVSRDHWYFRLNGISSDQVHVNEFLYDELPMFQTDQDPADRNSIFMVEPEKARGINCRFGMKGVIAETHYDPTRNWIVLLGGQRRYILSHPRECPHLHLYPVRHPSGRHSSVDWSNITHGDPTILQDARGTELIMQAADALYLPTSWFHFIVSLNINYQCNARSGNTHENDHFITDCGFPVGEI